MSFDLNFTPIREVNQDNVLIRAGAEWDEPRPLLQWLLHGAGYNLAVIALLATIFAKLWLLFLIPLLCFVLATMVCQTRRSVVFSADGETLLPYGLRGEGSLDRLHFHTDRIASLEAAPMRHQEEQGYHHFVRMITTRGSTIWLTENLQEWEALKVAVQLQIALDEIRGSKAYKPERVPGRPATASPALEMRIN